MDAIAIVGYGREVNRSLSIKDRSGNASGVGSLLRDVESSASGKLQSSGHLAVE
jgi:hypothetical protein